MFFIKNNYAVYEDYAICGTKGWICPNDTRYTDHDNKIYKREKVIRRQQEIIVCSLCGISKNKNRRNKKWETVIYQMQ